ncbi:hypothetical protein BGW36DRAFT_423246 [Talaromyces proteolyticus]|uniref:C2H2-type domain-containing protein n=1 Tax=Talaromyces proteolyticus TaxID=1131652 RepID=A0AAD4L1A6_9EURO|nr:uncharacterized protein BGW36DRAFT_423246 [Talaromyces proteolyticus]KAH8703695.1 hypothetical protein BGW36DRAFT_423246 [Talaromyces proteolyticus]
MDNRSYDPSRLHPGSAVRRPSSNRRSSASWTDGQSYMQLHFSTSSSPLTPTSHTSESVHQATLTDSLLLPAATQNTHGDTAGSYVWGGSTPNPVEDSIPLGDNVDLFPAVTVDPQTPNRYDGLPDLDSTTPSNPQALFIFVMRRLQEQFHQHPDPASFALSVARNNLDDETFRNSVWWASGDIRINPPVQPTRLATNSSQFVCYLCENPGTFPVRGTFKRHVNEQHLPKSYFHCWLCSSWKHPRRSKLVGHLRTIHSVLNSNTEQISAREILESVPAFCHICVSQGLQVHVNMFNTWDEWYDAIEDHCRIDSEPSPTGTSGPRPFNQDPDGGGSGGYGSAFPGSHGLSPSPSGFSSFGGSWGMSFTGSGGAYNTRSFSESPTSDDVLADKSKVSQLGSTKPTCLKHSNRDKGLLSSSKPNLTQRPRKDENGDTAKQDACNSCGHEYNSCAACPSRSTPSVPCHACLDRTALVISSSISSGTNTLVQGRDRPCFPVDKEEVISTNLSRRVNKLSLECRPSRANVSTCSPKSASQQDDVDTKPRTIMTVIYLSVVFDGYDPMSSLVVSIIQLSKNSSVAEPLCTDYNPKSDVDPLVSGQNILTCIHRDSPISHSKLSRQLSHCQASLGAISFELSTGTAMCPRSKSQKSRQKRLSSLLARLRAVTFILALQKEVTPETPEKCVFDDASQPGILRTIGKTISPSPARELKALYDLAYKHLQGDFWTYSGILGSKSSFAEDGPRACPFLRALATSISDPKLSISKKGAGYNPHTFLEDRVQSAFLR